MFNQILGQIVVLCFWGFMAFLSSELLKGYFNVFLIVIGLAASSLLVYRLVYKKEASNDFIRKIINDSVMSSVKFQEISALKGSGEQTKEVEHSHENQKTEVYYEH